MRRAFRAGATGYVSKLDGPAELSAGLGALAAGERFVSRRISSVFLQKLTSGRIKSTESEIDILSNREVEIFRMVGEGLGASAISRGLGVTVKTVETHCQRITVKLDLRGMEPLAWRRDG